MYQTTHTVQDVITDVTRQFGDESGVQVTEADVVRWVNEAQLYIGSKTKFLKSKINVTTDNTNQYSLTNLNIYQVESIHYDGTPVRNMAFPETEEYILSADPDLVESGDPAIWYEWAGTWSFWPKPPSGQTATIYITKMPDSVVLGGTLTVPDIYYPDLLNYVMQKAYELDEDFQNSQIKQRQISDSLNEKIEETRTAQSMTYSTITTYDL